MWWEDSAVIHNECITSKWTITVLKNAQFVRATAQGLSKIQDLQAKNQMLNIESMRDKQLNIMKDKKEPGDGRGFLV